MGIWYNKHIKTAVYGLQSLVGVYARNNTKPFRYCVKFITRFTNGELKREFFCMKHSCKENSVNSLKQQLFGFCSYVYQPQSEG